MKRYDKLVRDKIPQIIHDDGKTCDYHTASYDEYKASLYKKLTEELDEFINRPCYEEAADMWEVFSSICMLHDLDFSEVARTAYLKTQKRGGFNDRIILESVKDSQ